MSSHHIVRDNQEPALLILRADGTTLNSIQLLLEWSPFILVKEETLEEVLRWGIKVDAVLLVDPTNERLLEQIQHQQPIILLACRPNQELEEAKNYLTHRKFAAVNIATDQPDWQQLERIEGIHLSVIHENIRWVLIRKGHYQKQVDGGVAYFVRIGNSITRHEAWEGKIQETRTGLFWVGEPL